MTSTYRALGSNFAGSGTSLVITKPAGTTDGDLLVAIITTATGGGTITAPTGWKSFWADTSTCNVSVFTKTASGEGANFTFGWSSSVANIGGVFAYYSDSAATSKFVTVPEVQAQKTWSGSAQTLPAITANRASDLVLLIFIGPGSSPDFSSVPTNYTGLGEFVGSGCAFQLYYRLDAPAGAQSTQNLNTLQNGIVNHVAIPAYYAKQGGVL